MTWRVFYAARAAGVMMIGLALGATGCKPVSERRQTAERPAEQKPFVIAMIAKSSTNPVFQASLVGAQQAAREQSQKLGREVRIAWLTPPEIDGQAQAQRIAQAVNEGADALLVACADAGKVTEALKEAVARGVPVMMFDSDAPESGRFSVYAVDDTIAGQRTMEELAGLMGGKGRVAILAGNQNAPNLQRRVKGVRQAAARYPGISIVGTFYHVETPQDAAAEVTRVMNAYPEIDGWAFIGGWPLFTQSLLTTIDPAKVKIVSMDALPAQLAYVDRGVVPILLAQPVYEWGYVSVNTIVSHVLLHQPVPEYIGMPLTRVTKETLGAWARQLKAWQFSDVDPKYLAAP